jgi:hypothetical protein
MMLTVAGDGDVKWLKLCCFIEFARPCEIAEPRPLPDLGGTPVSLDAVAEALR